jgi:5-methylcytosine-specific restriction endonuclease McrA
MRQRYATDEHYRVKWRRMVHDRRRRIEPIDMEDAQELLKEFEGKCAYCGQPMTTFDHIIPVSKNGHSRLTNLLPACTSCNSSKRDTDVFDWMERTGKGTERAIEKAIFVTYVL